MDDEEGRQAQAEKTYTSAVELAIKAVRAGGRNCSSEAPPTCTTC